MPINSGDSNSLTLSTNEPTGANASAVTLEGQAAEDWVALCAQAAVEPDPKRLLDLVKEINRLLNARRQRLFNEGDRNFKPKDHIEDENADRRLTT